MTALFIWAIMIFVLFHLGRRRTTNLNNKKPGVFRGNLGGPQKIVLYAIIGFILGVVFVFGSHGCDVVLADKPPVCRMYDCDLSK